MKIIEFANHVDPDEVAYGELPHLHLHCLPLVLLISNIKKLVRNVFFFLYLFRKLKLKDRSRTILGRLTSTMSFCLLIT